MLLGDGYARQQVANRERLSASAKEKMMTNKMKTQQAPSNVDPEPLQHAMLGEGAEKRKKWRVGPVLGAILFGGAALALGSLSLGILMQASAESDAKDNLKAMRAESAWLVGEGLAVERPLGVFRTSVFAISDGFRPAGTRGAHAGPTNMLMGMEAPGILGIFAKRQWTISAGPDKSPAFVDYGVAAIYRHEEGHARLESQELAPLAPAFWPEAVSKVMMPIVGGKADVEAGDWRSAWLYGIRGEAFADAFAILSTARRGAAAMRGEALDIHASRIFYAAGAQYATALAAAGSDHVADPASLIAGQLDAAAVAKLDSAGIDELSGRIADAAIAHALARSGPAIGFFSKAGLEWWLGLASSAGLPREEAESAWTKWRADSESPAPLAVFGEQRWTIKGIDFAAPRIAAPPAGLMWRFDGLGGQVVAPGGFDPGAGGPVAAGEAVAMKIDSEGNKILPLPWRAESASQAWRGAVWTHWALASALGVSQDETAKKIARITQNPFAREKAACEMEGFAKMPTPGPVCAKMKLASRRGAAANKEGVAELGRIAKALTKG